MTQPPAAERGIVVPTLDMRALLEPLPPAVGARLHDAGPALQERVLAAARESSLRQSRPLSGAAGRGIETGVGTAVEEFLAVVADPSRDLTPAREVFRQLGREEFRDGRFIDALRSTLVTGAQAMWGVLVELGAARDVKPEHLYVLAGALFPFVDELSAAAARGYLEEQERTSIDFGMTRRRLLARLLQAEDGDPTTLQAAADAARWPLPDRLAVLVVRGTEPDQLARLVGAGATGAMLDDNAVLVIPEPDTPGRVDHLRRVVRGRAAALGATVPLAHARASYRQARRALHLHQRGELSSDGLVLCAEQLLPLILGWEEGLADALADRALVALAGVPAGQRRTLEETLLGWLREQGRVVPTAEALHVHPQTVRYRLRQLRQHLGAALDDPEQRHLLETALRWRLRGASATSR